MYTGDSIYAYAYMYTGDSIDALDAFQDDPLPIGRASQVRPC